MIDPVRARAEGDFRTGGWFERCSSCRSALTGGVSVCAVNVVIGGRIITTCGSWYCRELVARGIGVEA